MISRHGYLLTGTPGVYARTVPASAYAVASEIRTLLPAVPVKKLHKLLYFCQGMHLAWFGRSLFADTISAWDMGPVVGTLWKSEKDGQLPLVAGPLDEAQRNTIAYVVSRYGGLTGRDLEVLTHAQSPWRKADDSREPGGSHRIETAWLREWFTAELKIDEELVAPLVRRELLSGAVQRRGAPAARDDLEELRARLGQ
jgi:uncharacterized phage-associated protein